MKFWNCDASSSGSKSFSGELVVIFSLVPSSFFKSFIKTSVSLKHSLLFFSAYWKW